MTLDDVIKNSRKEEKILGIGANSTVYSIDELDDYEYIPVFFKQTLRKGCLPRMGCARNQNNHRLAP